MSDFPEFELPDSLNPLDVNEEDYQYTPSWSPETDLLSTPHHEPGAFAPLGALDVVAELIEADNFAAPEIEDPVVVPSPPAVPGPEDVVFGNELVDTTVDDQALVEDIPVEEDPAVDDGVYGNAWTWNDDWFWQGDTYYCVPTSAAFIINEFTGMGISDPELLASQAIDMGLTPDFSEGMYFVDIVPLLEAYDVPATHYYSSMEDMAAKLEAGYGVMVNVDSGEIWGDDPNDAAYEDGRADHALVVTQIDYNTGMVTLADPGHPEGNGMTVPIHVFENAWADSGFEAIATDMPDEDLAAKSGNPIMLANVSPSHKI